MPSISSKNSLTDKGQNRSIPLYVDLDETLIHTDTLYESIISLLKNNLLFLFILPFWLLSGKAYFKFKIGQHCTLEPKTLPYNCRLLEFLRQEKKRGRSLIMATACTRATAEKITNHLAIFDELIASTKKENLKGYAKLAAIKNHCHEQPFAYAGDSQADLAIWSAAAEVIIAGQAPGIKSKLAAMPLKIEADFSSPAPGVKAWLKAGRPHQWSKNLLVFVSLILAHKVAQFDLLRQCIIAWAAFSAAASGIYLFNDLFDLEADRHHKDKRFRPLASGNLKIKYAIMAAPLLMAAGLILSWPLSWPFKIVLTTYIATTSCYSLFLKRLVLLDVIILSLLYTIRIIAGSAAIGVSTTPWLLGFSLFLFLSLALAKRYSELLHYRSLDESAKIRGRGYKPEDVEQLAIFGSASGYISVLVLALYINSTASSALYNNPQFLWPICVLLIYWISRVWLLARRGELHEDPVIFTLHDRPSYYIGILTALLLYMAVNIP